MIDVDSHAAHYRMANIVILIIVDANDVMDSYTILVPPRLRSAISLAKQKMIPTTIQYYTLP